MFFILFDEKLMAEEKELGARVTGNKRFFLGFPGIWQKFDPKTQTEGNQNLWTSWMGQKKNKQDIWNF